MNKRYYFGIDLGTTNSVIAVYDAATGVSRAIKIGASPLVESQVWREKDSDVTRVGTLLKSKVDVAIRDVKSSISENVQYNFGDTKLTPIEVSAEVLRYIYTEAKEQFGEIDDVVITVPANFNHGQRMATLKAAKQAGIKVSSLVNEPTAAALAYMDNIEEPENILVYDLGGGTFDISLVNIMPKVKPLNIPKHDIHLDGLDHQLATVIASEGRVNLGGNDIDNLVLGIAQQRYSNSEDLLSEQRFKDIAKDLKTSKNKDNAKIVTPQKEDILLTREDVDKAVKVIFDETNILVSDVIRSHSSLPISRIVLVGGSTKSQTLQKLLAQEYPNIKIYSNINPDECVAIGAAKNNYIMNEETGMSFYDVVSGTYGTAITNEKHEPRMLRMIQKGSPIPVIKNVVLSKSYEDQDELSIDIYQGESLKLDNNTNLGSVVLKGIRNASMTEGLNCVFSINSSGMLVVTTKFQGVEQELKINTNEVTEEESKDDVMNAFISLTEEF